MYGLLKLIQEINRGWCGTRNMRLRYLTIECSRGHIQYLKEYKDEMGTIRGLRFYNDLHTGEPNQAVLEDGGVRIDLVEYTLDTQQQIHFG